MSNLARLVGAAILCAFAYTANAQTKELSLKEIEQSTAPPYALFQYSTLTGTGDTVTAALVPVVTATGTIYENVTLTFNVAANGTLTLASTQIVPAPTPIISSFLAGSYVGPSTILSGEAIINVAGPGVGPGGTTEWTLAAASGANCETYPGTATWYVGPLANSPLAARVQAAGITSTELYFGVASRGGCLYSYNWYTDTLIGVSQVGKTLTIVSFTYDGKDYPTPQDQITYTQQ